MDLYLALSLNVVSHRALSRLCLQTLLPPRHAPAHWGQSPKPQPEQRGLSGAGPLPKGGGEHLHFRPVAFPARPGTNLRCSSSSPHPPSLVGCIFLADKDKGKKRREGEREKRNKEEKGSFFCGVLKKMEITLQRRGEGPGIFKASSSPWK